MQKNLYRFVVCAICTFFIFSTASAQQTGTLKGQIIDSTANEALVGATAQIENTTIGVAADIDGNYQLTGLQAGKYNILFSMVGYQTQKLVGIEIFAGKVTVLNINLKTDSAQLEGVVLTTQRETLSELAVISEIKQAEQVAVGISGEQISKTQDRDAAQVVKRIAGVSIFDDRFIMIRGLSQRYNTVMLNDAIAPSSEVDIRAFSFDMLPSSAIDRIMIYKSGAGELPGEFAGGIVKVYTKLAPTENFTNISIGTGFRAGTTFQEMPNYEGGKTDFLGFDNGTRGMPESMPDVRKFKALGIEERAKFGQKFNNIWNTTNTVASPDLRLNYTMGRRFSAGSVDIGNFTAISYSNTRQKLTDVQLTRFGDLTVNPNDLDVKYTDNIGNNNVRLSAISNWSFIFNRYNKIEFRNFFNQMGMKETLEREGILFKEAPEKIRRYTSLRYEQRSIYSSQLSGKHNIGSTERNTLKWLAGFGFTNRREPDFKRYIQTREINTPDQPFSIVISNAPNSSESSRFFTKLNEYVFTGSVNFERNLQDKEEEENPAKFRAGIYTEYKTRQFQSRIFGYIRSAQSTVSDLRFSPEELFKPENVNGTTGFVFEEGGDTEKDAYKATNMLVAPYLSLYYPITPKFSATIGTRFEYNDQQILSNPNGNGFTKKQGGKAIGSFLPSLNLTYNLTDKSLFRLAYSASINRPEFRELARFDYYEPNLDAIQRGNPNLGIARISNVDLRWEYYPTPNETITFGAFYKYFRNPIENQVLASSGQSTYSFIQVDNAQSYGIETEIRKGFANSSNKFFQNLTVVLNASYIISRVQNPETIVLSDGERLSTKGTLPEKRIMFGQSPYLINGGIFYTDDVTKWSFSALYNVFGTRLFAIGNVTDNPSQYELPRHGLDISVGKGFKSGFDVRLGIQDLLNPAFKIVEDTDVNGKISKQERNNVLYTYRRGQYFTLTLGYKF